MLKKIVFLLFICVSYIIAANGDKQITLSGKINKNIPNKISAKQLEKILPTSTHTIYNPWEKKTEKYEGVLLDEFIKHFGADDTTKIELIALDDYRVDISKQLASQERILLVTKINDQYQSIRQKGPMRIIFIDFDKRNKKYEDTLPLWLWMITRIEFK